MAYYDRISDRNYYQNPLYRSIDSFGSATFGRDSYMKRRPNIGNTYSRPNPNFERILALREYIDRIFSNIQINRRSYSPFQSGYSPSQLRMYSPYQSSNYSNSYKSFKR